VSLIGAAIGEPSRQALALGAVPVTTGIIGDAEMGSDMIEPLLGQLAGASTNQRDVIARDVEQLCETGRAARRSAAFADSCYKRALHRGAKSAAPASGKKVFAFAPEQ
jgi:hypothetical protein